MEKAPNIRFLNVKALVVTFNKEKAPIKAFSLLKATTGTFTFKNLY